MSVKAKAKREQLIVEARHENMIVSSSASSSFSSLRKSHQNPTRMLQNFQPHHLQRAEYEHNKALGLGFAQTEENIPLAASGHNRCTSLVCSCYVAPRNSDSKDGESSRSGTSNNHRKQRLSENKYGFFHEFCSDESEVQVKSTSGIGRDNGRSNAPQIEPMPLKSNLKKASESLEFNQRLRMGSRKVNWPDAHGKDIAHVQEFEPSVSEDGELESVRNSCVCIIQ